jgi:hypothetical protein
MSEETVERDFMSEAKEQGWMDEDAYREAHGHAKGWSDAKTFVENGEKILPIVNSKNKKLQAELESLKSELTDIKSATNDWKEFTKAERERLKERIEQQEKELRSARAKAVGDGDPKAFAEADEKLESLRSQKEAAKANGSDQERIRDIQKSVDKWKADNDWYETDYTKTAALNGAANDVVREKPDLQGSGVKLFEAAHKRAEEMFPELFKEGSGTSKVEAGGNRSRSSSKKTYDALPADAKAACDKFVKQGLFESREEYVKSYEWE